MARRVILWLALLAAVWLAAAAVAQMPPMPPMPVCGTDVAAPAAGTNSFTATASCAAPPTQCICIPRVSDPDAGTGAIGTPVISGNTCTCTFAVAPEAPRAVLSGAACVVCP